MGACGSSDDTDDAKPTTGKSDNTTTPTDKKETVTVTFDLNYEGATAPPDAQTIKKGDRAKVPTPQPTRAGYKLTNWYTDAATTKVFAFATTPITGDITLYAKWICPAREARKALNHVVPLYNGGKADAPYLPKALRQDFAVEPRSAMVFIFFNMGTPKEGEKDQLPNISPSLTSDSQVEIKTGNFDITPDYIDASLRVEGTWTVRISCYSVKEVEKDLYFYYGKVKFLRNGKETEAFNKAMYAWTGIDKRDPANKDALYGYMVSIQGNYLRPLTVYPFVGGTYTRAADGETVIFPKTEKQYAALTLDQLKIIETVNPTSEKLFGTFGEPPAGIYRGN